MTRPPTASSPPARPGCGCWTGSSPPRCCARLPAYDIGLATFNTGLNAAHLDTALPNKAFEYLASGVPIAVGPHHALEGLVERNGVGVVIDRPGDLAARLREADMPALRARVAERRHRFTVEGHIDALVRLYHGAVGSARPASLTPG